MLTNMLCFIEEVGWLLYRSAMIDNKSEANGFDTSPH
jgi:hypothetical protein